MTNDEIMAKLQEIFRETFDNASLEISRNTSSSDIEEWDSLMHITLVGEVQEAFGMKFTLEQVTEMKNVGEMADIVAKALSK